MIKPAPANGRDIPCPACGTRFERIEFDLSNRFRCPVVGCWFNSNPVPTPIVDAIRKRVDALNAPRIDLGVSICTGTDSRPFAGLRGRFILILAALLCGKKRSFFVSTERGIEWKRI